MLQSSQLSPAVARRLETGLSLWTGRKKYDKEDEHTTRGGGGGGEGRGVQRETNTYDREEKLTKERGKVPRRETIRQGGKTYERERKSPTESYEKYDREQKSTTNMKSYEKEGRSTTAKR